MTECTVHENIDIGVNSLKNIIVDASLWTEIQSFNVSLKRIVVELKLSSEKLYFEISEFIYIYYHGQVTALKKYRVGPFKKTDIVTKEVARTYIKIIYKLPPITVCGVNDF